MSTPRTSAPRRAAGSAVVPSPQPRSVREVGAHEPPPLPPTSVRLAVGARRGELLAAVWPLAAAGYADLPLPGWPRSRTPSGCVTRRPGPRWFVALAGDEPIGCARLLAHADGDG